MTPDFIRGVININLRGRAVPAIDLSLRFGHAETVIGRRTSVIVVTVSETVGGGIRADYISGMAKRDNDFIVVLDIGRVLSLRDIAALNNAMAEATGSGEP